MFERVKKLVFQGAAFSSRTSFPLFPSQKQRLCLIYGKNGTGKSTISKAFLKVSGADSPEIVYASLEDYLGNSMPCPVDGQDFKIFVFNEEYVQSRVRLKEDGLGTIVVFGKQVELETQIESAKKEYETATYEKEKSAAVLASFNDESHVISPLYYLSRMKEALSGDCNWAGRERLISGSRRNASVNDKTYESIVKNKPEKSREEIETEYREQYDLLCAAQSGNALIPVAVNSRIFVPNNEEAARQLLALRIEKPELSKRELYLLSLVEAGKINHVEHIKSVFEVPETDSCPFCLQSVTPKYKEALVQSVKKILSKIVEEHKAALRALIVPIVEIDFTPYQKLDKRVLEKCKSTLSALNEAIDILDDALSAKSDNPYSSIELKELKINEKATNLIHALEELEAARIEFNKPLSNIPQLQKALSKLNAFKAYYEVESNYNAFLKQNREKEKAETDFSKRLIAEQDKKRVLENLQMQRRSIRIAIDLINTRLSYVFFDNRRLTIEADETGTMYTLRSNGAYVKPSEISVGERNILALCYFFVEMLDNTDVRNAFSKESLVIVDDPISSFDHENRIGIMSLLRHDIENVVLGNDNSKVVFLTHDLQAAFDLQKALGEIVQIVNKRKKCECGFKVFELKNQTIEDFRYSKRHEYSELLSTVFRYGVSASLKDDATIGNAMRRTLEAFSTFVYKKGICEIGSDEDILKSLDEKYVDYFRCLMYRLVLNGESHSEERVRSMMDDNDFLEMMSSTEKQRIARDIICFIFLLNPCHVRAHLTNSEGVLNYESEIEKWCEDIKSFVASTW